MKESCQYRVFFVQDFCLGLIWGLGYFRVWCSSKQWLEYLVNIVFFVWMVEPTETFTRPCANLQACLLHQVSFRILSKPSLVRSKTRQTRHSIPIFSLNIHQASNLHVLFLWLTKQKRAGLGWKVSHFSPPLYKCITRC